MSFSCYLLASSLVVWIAVSQSSAKDSVISFPCSFSEYTYQFNKHYSTPEESALRQSIFLQNCNMINHHNSQPGQTYLLSINNLSDRTLEELQGNNPLSSSLDLLVTASSPAPPSLNYQAYGSSATMINVGKCNAGWAFAATRMYEYIIRQYGQLYQLSTEATLQCSSKYAPKQRVNDCANGLIEDALNMLSLVGGLGNQNYPFVASGLTKGLPSTLNICSDKNRIFLGNGTVVSLFNISEKDLKSTLSQNGPVVVAIYLDSKMASYSSGIFSGCPSVIQQSQITYPMLLIGYDQNSWILENRWGPNWGLSGNVKIVLGANNCGIGREVRYINFTKINANVQTSMDPTKYYTKHSESLINYFLCLAIMIIYI